MKKLYLSGMFFLLAFFFITEANSQSLYFCEGVDEDGYAIKSSSTFNISSNGGYLYFLVRMGGGKKANCYEVLYDIYRVDSRGKETFDNTIYQDVEPNWNWFWKQITFYDPGTYKVYVYNEDWKFLTSGTLKVKYN